MTEVACLAAKTGEVECVTMNVEPHELRGYLGHAVGTSLSPAILDCDCGPRSSRVRAVALRKRRPMGSLPKALSRQRGLAHLQRFAPCRASFCAAKGRQWVALRLTSRGLFGT
jgi:hypothetical protein